MSYRVKPSWRGTMSIHWECPLHNFYYKWAANLHIERTSFNVRSPAMVAEEKDPKFCLYAYRDSWSIMVVETQVYIQGKARSTAHAMEQCVNTYIKIASDYETHLYVNMWRDK